MFHLIRQVFHLINLPVLLVDSQRGFVVQALMGNLKASPGCRHIYIYNIIKHKKNCHRWYIDMCALTLSRQALSASRIEVTCPILSVTSSSIAFRYFSPLSVQKNSCLFLSCKICNYTWLIRQVTRVSSCFASTSKRWSSHLLGWLPGICIEADRILKSKLIDTSTAEYNGEAGLICSLQEFLLGILRLLFSNLFRGLFLFLFLGFLVSSRLLWFFALVFFPILRIRLFSLILAALRTGLSFLRVFLGFLILFVLQRIEQPRNHHGYPWKS